MAAEVGTHCTTFASGTAFLGGAVGYGIRFWISKQSANRKEDWERLRDLTDLVNGLVDETIGFFCVLDNNENERQRKCISIQRMISKTNQQAFLLSRVFGEKQINSYQKRLRQAITMEEFDSDITRAPLSLADERIIKIETECSALIGALNLCYARNYRGSQK